MPTIGPKLPKIPQRLAKVTKIDHGVLDNCNHWSCGLGPGDRKVIEGVVVTKLGDGKPKASVSKPLFAGVPDDEQPNFDIEPIEVKDAESMEAYHKKQKELVRWYAKYWGKFLSDEKRSVYEQLMLSTYEETWKILKPAAEETWNKKTGIDFAGIRAQLADRLSEHLMSEIKIFDGNDKAAQRRYGKQANLSKTPKKNELKDTLEAMLSGAYLKREEKKSEASHSLDMPHPTIEARSTTTTPGLFGGRVEFVQEALPLVSGKHRYKTYTDLGEPVVGGAEARVCVFTHEIADLPWTAPLHTSIVVGVWTIEQQLRKVETWEREVPGLPVVGRSGSEWLPVLIDQRTVLVTRARFLNWDLANGCAGTYPRDDFHTTVAIATYSGSDLPTTLGELRKWVYGCTPSAGGHYYPIRAAAYSVGMYFMDWVCHNCANAFAYLKWGLIPVSSGFTSSWGLFGMKGISPREDMWGAVHQGCVPGNECYYNMAPPYVEPLVALGEDLLCAGEAHNLHTFWNDAKSQWKPTEAKFNEKDVASGGYDYTISVTPCS